MKSNLRGWLGLAVAATVIGAAIAGAQGGGQRHSHEIADACDGSDEAEDSPELRAVAQQRVQWRAKHVPPGANQAAWQHVKLLGFNDFHGQLSVGRRVGTRPVGGAAVLASYLSEAARGVEGETIIVHAGDHVGASPPESALLQDEPSIQFLNLLANDACDHADLANPRCNLVGTLGNHEFDEGKNELFRLLFGGNHEFGPFLEDPWRGARFPYVSANVVDADDGQPILPPYVIKKIGGTNVAFIGAVLEATPTVVTPTGVAGLAFLDEADAINRWVPEIVGRHHVKTIIVTIHQGGRQTSFTGPTPPAPGAVSGEILEIVSRLDDEIDVVVSGHTHSFTNAIVPNAHGKEMLVAQAFSSSTAYDDIDIWIDPATKDVVQKSASIVTTWGDEGPGLIPDSAVAALVASAEETVAPLVNMVIAEAAADITRVENPAGESALGNLIADAQRSAMGTDFAFMNPGGIRNDIFAGEATWGELFSVQPFGNNLVRMTLTGAQVKQLLEQQWQQASPRILKTSGLVYTWDAAAPVGSRVVSIHQNGVPLDPGASYTVTVNSFLAAGGDNFTVLTQGANPTGGPVDLDALIDYVASLAQPFSAAIEGRINRIN